MDAIFHDILRPVLDRSLNLPLPGSETFFLWGSRQSGKTTLLKQRYPQARWIDLRRRDAFRRYATHPELLRLEIEENPPDRGQQIVIDEIQKVPALLDEVHGLIEDRNLCFALCGSSTRKVRRGVANVLGDRVLRFELLGLTAHELGSAFDLVRVLNHGYMPRIYESALPAERLDAYVSDYLIEEVATGGLGRSLPSFSDFLEAASLGDGGIVNYTNIARDCGVSNRTIKGYFQILEDTFLGSWLPAYRKRVKRRLALSPKFYFSDVGVVNSLARRGQLRPGTELFGKAFENWVHHEIRSYLACSRPNSTLAYWRLPSGLEVDFVVDDIDLAVEAKASSRIHSGHLKGLKALAQELPNVARRVVVCLDRKPWRTDDGIEILPAHEFVERLWSGRLTESRG